MSLEQGDKSNDGDWVLINPQPAIDHSGLCGMSAFVHEDVGR